MAERSLWHSTWSEVYRANTECNTGNSIENEYGIPAASGAAGSASGSAARGGSPAWKRWTRCPR
jgi:hypothetical protein